MQLVLFQLIPGVVTDVIAHLYDSVKKAFLAAESDKEDEFALAAVAIKEPRYRTGD